MNSKWLPWLPTSQLHSKAENSVKAIVEKMLFPNSPAVGVPSTLTGQANRSQAWLLLGVRETDKVLATSDLSQGVGILPKQKWGVAVG